MTRSPLVLVLLLWVAGLCAAAQFAKFGVIVPELLLAYPVDPALIGLLVSLISAMGLVLGLVAGALAAPIGLKRLLVASLVLGAIVSLAQAAMPPLPVMFALRVVEGLSHLGVVVTAPTLIGTLTPVHRRGAAMTLWGTFFGVAFALTAWLGVPLATASGPGAVFLAHAIATGLIAAVLLAALPADGAARGEAPGLRAVMGRHRTAYASPFVAAAPLGWLFYTFTFVALVTVLPTLVPEASRALVATWMPIASIVVSMTLGVALLRLVSAISVVALGFLAAMGVALVYLALPGSVWLPVALFGALGLVQGASFAAIPQLNSAPADQALANGAMAQMGNAGNVSGTLVLLAVLAASDVRTMIAVVIGCYAVGLVAHALTAQARARSAHA